MSTKTLFDLDEDILHLIILELSTSSPTSVCTFSRVSKTTHKLANPIIWRTVKIGEEYGHYYSTVDFVRPSKKPFLGREGVKDLLSKTNLVELVKEIVVQNVGKREKFVTDSELARIIKDTKTLAKFSWNSEFPIGQETLAALDEHKPDVELNATRQSDVYMTSPLDVSLLSSRLLKGLSHNIAWARTSLFAEENDGDTVSSQFEEMDSILSQSNSIRVLNFRLNTLNSITPISTATIVDMNATEHIPEKTFNNILSLDIPADYGNANRSPASHRILTSLLVSRLHNWRSVQELHLSGLQASYTFEHLKDSVPNLRRLDLMFPARYSNSGELAPELVAQFILALENLKELKIRDMNQEEVDVVWPAIVEKKHTLRSLDLYAGATLGMMAPVWEARHFDEILTDSALFHLALPISIATLVAWSQDSTPHTIPAAINLRTLKISAHIPTDQTSIFSEKYHYDAYGGSEPVPPLNVDKGKEIAAGIFKSLCLGGKGNTDGRFKELELSLVRLAVYDRAQTEEVKTSVFVKRVGSVEMVVDVVEARY